MLLIFAQACRRSGLRCLQDMARLQRYVHLSIFQHPQDCCREKMCTHRFGCGGAGAVGHLEAFGFDTAASISLPVTMDEIDPIAGV